MCCFEQFWGGHIKTERLLFLDMVNIADCATFRDFDLKQFEAWLEKKKTAFIPWDQESRLKMIIYVMKTRRYDTVYEIQNYDFKNTKIGDFNKVYYDKRFTAKD